MVRIRWPAISVDLGAIADAFHLLLGAIMAGLTERLQGRQDERIPGLGCLVAGRVIGNLSRYDQALLSA
jgi:hypothetical protein